MAGRSTTSSTDRPRPNAASVAAHRGAFVDGARNTLNRGRPTTTGSDLRCGTTPQLVPAAAGAEDGHEARSTGRSANQDAKASPASSIRQRSRRDRRRSEPPQQLGPGEHRALGQPADRAQVLAERDGKVRQGDVYCRSSSANRRRTLPYCEDKWDKDPRCMRNDRKQSLMLKPRARRRFTHCQTRTTPRSPRGPTASAAAAG